MELGYGILYLVKICCISKAMFTVYWIQSSSCTANVNHTGKGLCSHIRTLISVRFL